MFNHLLKVSLGRRQTRRFPNWPRKRSWRRLTMLFGGEWLPHPRIAFDPVFVHLIFCVMRCPGHYVHGQGKLQQFRWKLRSTNVHLQGWKVRKHMQLRTLTQHCLRWVTYVHWTMDIVQFKNVQNYGFQWQWHLPRDFLGAPHPNMGEPVISRIGHCTKGASANPQEWILRFNCHQNVFLAFQVCLAWLAALYLPYNGYWASTNGLLWSDLWLLLLLKLHNGWSCPTQTFKFMLGVTLLYFHK